MKYISTRDSSIQLSASQAILQGISPEGGLFVPESFPQVDLDFIRGLEGLSYWERAERVMALYLDDFSHEDLESCTKAPILAPLTEISRAGSGSGGSAPAGAVAWSHLRIQGYGPADAAPAGFHSAPQSGR